MQKLFASFHTFLYRILRGRGVGKMGAAPILLLTTTGRKTGKERETPLMYFNDGDDLFLIASNGGRDAHPLWYLNLRDNPNVKVRIGTDERSLVARTATVAEHDRLWPKAAAAYKGYDKYVKKTERHIPMVVLSGMRASTRWSRVVPACCALLLVAGACGGDDDKKSATDKSDRTTTHRRRHGRR